MHQGPARDYTAIGRLPDWEARIIATVDAERQHGELDDLKLHRLHNGCEPDDCRFRRTRDGRFEVQKELLHAERLRGSRPFASEPWLRCERCIFSYYGELEHDKSILAAYGVKTEAPPKEESGPARYQQTRRQTRKQRRKNRAAVVSGIVSAVLPKC